jgi:methylmalonyl-CoA mutase
MSMPTDTSGEPNVAHVSFDEFAPLLTPQWQAQVAKDLKGKGTADQLVWKPFRQYPDVNLAATYLADSELPATAGSIQQLLQNRPAGWAYREMLCLDAGQEAQVVQQALDCLSWGTDQISIWGTASPDYSKLLGQLGKAGVKGVRLYIEAPYGVIEGAADHPYWPNMGGCLVWVPSMTPTYVGETGYLKSLATLLSDYPQVSILADVSGYAEAGASIISQQAIALSILAEWLHRLSDSSIEPKTLVDKIEMHVGLGPNYLLELAGLRALRYNLTQVWRAFGVDVASVQIWARACQAWSTPQDPDTNLLRTTTTALAAIAGGADVMSLPQHSAGVAGRTAEEIDNAMRWARNVSHLLRHEAFMGLVADPAAGSRYLEQATSMIGQAAWDQFQAWEAKGGYLSCYKNQVLQSWVRDEAATNHAEVTNGSTTIVGGNKFRPDSPAAVQLFGQPMPGLDPANFGLIVA